MWRKKISYEKTWAGFKKVFAEDYHDILKLQCINATQPGFHGYNISIIMNGDISKALENLSTATNPEKYVLTQITSTIK